MSKLKPKAVKEKGLPVRSEPTPPFYCPCNAVRDFSHLAMYVIFTFFWL